MANNAALYEVQGPHGQYVALYDPATGRLWTERSEAAARSLADEMGLNVDPLKPITHAALMRLAGRDTTVVRAPAQPKPPPEVEPEKPQRPVVSRKPFAPVEPTGPIVTATAGHDVAPFATQEPVTPVIGGASSDAPPHAAGHAQSDDVLSEKRTPLTRRGKSPFADRKPDRPS